MMLLKTWIISSLIVFTLCCLDSCQYCDSTGTVCLQCLSSDLVPFIDGGCYSSYKIEHCAIYSSQGKCQKCLPTYKWKKESTECIKDQSGCIEFNQNGMCMKCEDGMNLLKGTCYGIIHCEITNSINDDECSKCIDGFKSTGSFCQHIHGCSKKDTTGRICTVCQDGYELNGFSCISKIIQKPIGCSILNFDGKCRYCNSGAAAIQGVCIKTNEIGINYKYLLQSKQLASETISNQQKTLPNCQTVDQTAGTCIRCVYGFYLNKGNCLAVSPLCDGYDILGGQGKCLQCVSGYSLNTDKTCSQVKNQAQSLSQTQPISQQIQGNVEQQPKQQNQIPNCGQFSQNGSCSSCQAPYIQASDGYCYDPKCLSGTQGICGLCQPGMYVSQKTRCIDIPIQGCSNYTNNQCVSCNQGLNLINGNCVSQTQQQQQQQHQGQVFNQFVVQQPASQQLQTQTLSQPLPTSLQQLQPQSQQLIQDPYCRQYSPSGQCSGCFQSYVLGANGRCTLINQQCATVDNSGRCSTCYPGYILQNGNCYTSAGDANCRTYSQSGSCTQCSDRYFLLNGICTLSNNLCQNIDRNTGNCISCYAGYSLRNGVCSVFIQDPNCRTYSATGCTICSPGFYMASDGKCVMISPLCQTANNVTGKCLSCFPGYSLDVSGQCVISNRAPGCARMQNGQCISCISGNYLRGGSCYQISPLCATYDNQTGFCLSCYQGYSLSGGNCTTSSSLNNCKTSQNGQCRQCFQGFVLQNGNCITVNPLCRTSDQFGNCLSCYQGYALANGNCTLPTNNDPNCIQKSGSFCLSCTNGYYILSGSCTRLTKNCASYQMSTGNCISCGAGYQTMNGDCVPAAQRADVNCIQVGPNGNCISCNQGYYINASSGNNTCQIVSQLCFNFNYQTLQCTQCQNGYFLQDGGCIYPSMGYDQFCQRYSGSYCQRCVTGYFLQNYRCAKVDPNCISFNYSSSTCQQCRIGNPNGSTCQ